MNPRTRRAALYAIGMIAILASGNALAHSYAGLYEWAVHHRLSGWQAKSWPAEIDVFLAVGELALYVAYLDGWPVRQRVWPWTTALVGLAVSIAGNVGHIQARPGQPVLLADRLTAATSPVAAFAGLTVGLLVLKMTRQRRLGRAAEPRVATALVLAHPPTATGFAAGGDASGGSSADLRWPGEVTRQRQGGQGRDRPAACIIGRITWVICPMGTPDLRTEPGRLRRLVAWARTGSTSPTNQTSSPRRAFRHTRRSLGGGHATARRWDG
jgi:hypothetical protein